MNEETMKDEHNTVGHITGSEEMRKNGTGMLKWLSFVMSTKQWVWEYYVP